MEMTMHGHGSGDKAQEQADNEGALERWWSHTQRFSVGPAHRVATKNKPVVPSRMVSSASPDASRDVPSTPMSGPSTAEEWNFPEATEEMSSQIQPWWARHGEERDLVRASELWSSRFVHQEDSSSDEQGPHMWHRRPSHGQEHKSQAAKLRKQVNTPTLQLPFAQLDPFAEWLQWHHRPWTTSSLAERSGPGWLRSPQGSKIRSACRHPWEQVQVGSEGSDGVGPHTSKHEVSESNMSLSTSNGKKLLNGWTATPQSSPRTPGQRLDSMCVEWLQRSAQQSCRGAVHSEAASVSSRASSARLQRRAKQRVGRLRPLPSQKRWR